jgi:hypothetical protein
MAGFELSAQRGVGEDDSVLAIERPAVRIHSPERIRGRRKNGFPGECFREIDQIGGGR